MNFTMFKLKTISAFSTEKTDCEIVDGVLFTCPFCKKNTQLNLDKNLKDDILYKSKTTCSGCKKEIRLYRFLKYEKE